MVNKVILLGNVGKDPEVRHLEGGATVATLTLATSESYKNHSGEKVTQTEWHNLVIWNSLAKVAEQYIKKGDRLYIEGRIRSRQYEAQDGSKRYITEVFVNSLKMLGSAVKATNSQAGSDPEGEEDYSYEGETGLPF